MARFHSLHVLIDVFPLHLSTTILMPSVFLYISHLVTLPPSQSTLKILQKCIIQLSILLDLLLCRDRNTELDKVFKNKTVAATYKKFRSVVSSSTFSRHIPLLTIVICSINIVKEIIQVLIQRLRYFRKGNNYLEWTLYISTIVFMLNFWIDTNLVNFTQKWTAGAISVFLTWVNLLLFLTRFPYFGVYVEMFVEVLGTVLRVLVVFGIFIVAFSLSFYALLRELPTFNTVERSLMKVKLIVFTNIFARFSCIS